MTRFEFGMILTLATLVCPSARAAGTGSDYPVQPVPFTRVSVQDDFWRPRLETNRVVTIPYDFRQCEATGRIDNFAKAGGMMEGEFKGIRFDDSDVFKIIEGAAFSLALRPDAWLDNYLDRLIAKIAAAQEDDGYLYTARTIDPRHPAGGAGPTRWCNLKESHELYNVGHLYEAAVAHYQATGKRSLLDVALKNADLVCHVFGPDKLRDVPGHQEIEIGLVKLYRVTGEAKYLRQAKFFLDMRGRADQREIWGEYCQDHKPVVEQSEATGHAVRAGYMYAGMADVAALTQDRPYIEAITRIWRDVVDGKLYLTGGMGSRSGGEAFGADYELPNLTAYNETCAAIANMLWNHRLFLLTGDAKYIDVFERTLYNGFLSGVSLTGDLFFYPNPLESDGTAKRSPWFDCACCPPNVARFIPSIPGYVYAQQDDSIYVNLFIQGEASLALAGHTIQLRQETRYPWEGRVRITVQTAAPVEFTLLVRIPGWAQNRPVPSDLYFYADAAPGPVSLQVNGTALLPPLEQGYLPLKRVWTNGDTVDLDLPMPVRRVRAHDQVRDDRGLVALERGPVVYCAEWVDNEADLSRLRVPETMTFDTSVRKFMLGGVVMLHGSVPRGAEDDAEVPDLTLIPYYAWAHRGEGPMKVWLPVSLNTAPVLREEITNPNKTG
ncbi:MAG: glycoside hydrolase family 127 protein [bacterium]